MRFEKKVRTMAPKHGRVPDPWVLSKSQFFFFFFLVCTMKFKRFQKDPFAKNANLFTYTSETQKKKIKKETNFPDQ